MVEHCYREYLRWFGKGRFQSGIVRSPLAPARSSYHPSHVRDIYSVPKVLSDSLLDFETCGTKFKFFVEQDPLGT